jgi:hypothetical protein
MPPDSSVTMADASESSKADSSLSEQHTAPAAASAVPAVNHNAALIKELEERLRSQRRNLRMHKHPIKTLR